ncbi:Cell division protein FtsX [Oligella urethralis]|uniref:cell division protein FtsX n=1 Tax=Oligella TaxID=90243 RepID=UPI0003803CA8|nr:MULTISPECIES: ABC transporter permease [Oligella]AVL70282.1 ABC transporter permease [Oligella urethralis]OFV47446.1 permease [Oligella sp. HMSC09E12]SUA53485.1 Cell division protein FtsX [Oligella urethralis]SUA64212.1 Cell division protein FtsX [Oligella urethralis]
MRSWLRQHGYALKVALRRIIQTPFSSLANILVIAFVLSLPLIAASLLVSLEPVTRTVSVNPAITLFMKDTLSLDETNELSQRIRADSSDLIQMIEVVDKNKALEDLKNTPAWSESLSVLPKNPLPHAIIVTLSNSGQDFVNSERVLALADEFAGYDEVDLVQFDSEWVQKLQAIMTFIKVVLILLAIGVSVVVIATVFNTVRMQALVQRDEISVARLVGATESFVRRPFLYFGAVVGFVAGIVAILLSSFALMLLNNSIQEVISQTYEQPFMVQLPETFWLIFSIVLAMIVAAVAARWSVTRHSKF